jgi:hypothetical protein
MQFVLTSDWAFSIAGLPELDADQRVALATRLVTEGLLEPAIRNDV